jgi:hypothetical protein
MLSGRMKSANYYWLAKNISISNFMRPGTSITLSGLIHSPWAPPHRLRAQPLMWQLSLLRLQSLVVTVLGTAATTHKVSGVVSFL